MTGHTRLVNIAAGRPPRVARGAARSGRRPATGRAACRAAGFTLLLALGAGAAEPDAAPWTVERRGAHGLAAELRFSAEGVYEFGVENGAAGVLRPLAPFAPGEARFLLEPLLGRSLPAAPVTVFARGEGPTFLCAVSFDLPEGWAPFACARTPGAGLETVRKQALGVPGGTERALLGGSAVSPDAVERPGWSGGGEWAALGGCAADLERTTAFLPAVCAGAAGPVFAWSAQPASASPGVWVASAAGRCVRLAAEGSFPCLAASGRRIACVWSTGEKVFTAASDDGGATWAAAREVASSLAIARATAALRGDCMAIAWETPQGISWRVSADGGRSFGAAGELAGGYSRPRAEILADGVPAVAYLRRGPRGNEAALTRLAAPDRGGEKTEVLLDSVPVLDVALRRIEGAPFFAGLVRAGRGVRIAHGAPGGRTYFLPATRGTPFAVDAGLWNGALCVSYAQVRVGAIELLAFLSSDRGLTWKGPVRLLSGRALCVLGAELVVAWRRARGKVSVNGTEVFTLPEGVSSGRARVGLDPGRCAAQGWLADRASFAGEGTVDVTVLLRTAPYEDVFPGLNEAHAAELAAAGRRRSSGPDLALLAETVSAKRLSGRAGGELVLPLGVANVGDRASGKAALVVRAGGETVFRKDCGAIEPGGEINVSARVPMPSAPGTVALCCAVETRDDRDGGNDALELAVEVRPEHVTILAPGAETRLALPDEEHVTLACEAPCYLAVDTGGLDPAAVRAVFAGEDGTREVPCVGPIDVAAGTHRVLFRADAAGRIGVRLVLKTDAFEPNDRPEDAARVLPGSELELRLIPAGDRDWFAVPAAGEGHLTLRAAGLVEGAELVASVRAGGAWVIREAPLPCAVFVQPGICEVMLAERWGRAVAEPFRLRIGLTGAADPDEPNDTPAKARPFDLVKGERVVLDPPGDKDWYSLEAAAPGWLAFRAHDSPGTVTCLLAAEDESSLAPPADLPVILRAPAGKLFVCFSTRAEEPVAARVTIEHIAELEGAGAGEGARAAALPGEVEVTLWPEGGSELIDVRVPGHGFLKVALPAGAPPELAPAASVWSGGAPLSALRLLPAVFRVGPGEARVEVRDALARGVPRSFRVGLDFDAVPEAERVHDAPERAAALACPGSLRLTLWPADDTSFVKAEVPARGLLRVEAAGADRGLEFFFPQEKSGRRVQRGRAAVVRVEPGACLVRVRPLAPLREPLRCTLSARLDSVDDAGEPNDTPEEASPLAPGAWRTLLLFPRDDADWFRLEAGRGGVFTFEVRGAPADLAPRVDVLGPHGAVLAEGVAPGGVFTAGAGTCLVRLYEAAGRAARAPFEVRVAPGGAGGHP